MDGFVLLLVKKILKNFKFFLLQISLKSIEATQAILGNKSCDEQADPTGHFEEDAKLANCLVQEISNRLVIQLHQISNFFQAEIMVIAQLNGFLLAFWEFLNRFLQFHNLFQLNFLTYKFMLVREISHDIFQNTFVNTERNIVLFFEVFKNSVPERPEQIKFNGIGFRKIISM